MKVAYIFPNSTSARFSAVRLLETKHKVVFYCPQKFDLEIAQNMINELNIIGKEQNEILEIEDSFEVRTEDGDLRDCNIIGC